MLHPFVRTFSYFNALRSFFFQAFGDHRSLPSFPTRRSSDLRVSLPEQSVTIGYECALPAASHRHLDPGRPMTDRKSTRLNSSHPSISYAVFCLKKKTINDQVFVLQCTTIKKFSRTLFRKIIY